MPQVSIIIPTYNREKYIERAIKSVQNQTFVDWELLITDDGSTDNTHNIVQDYIKKDKRINYFYQKNSGGPASPRNIGIEKATGKYVAFLDSDDEWLPEKLKKQLYIFEKTSFKNLGFVGCNVNVIKELDNKNKEFKIKHKGDIFNEILKGNFILSCTNILIKKDVLLEVGNFDTKLKYLDDWDMWLRVSKANYEFDFINYPLFNYYLHKTNITNNFNKLQILLESEFILNKYEILMKNAKINLKIGLQFLLANEDKKAQQYIRNSFIINPKNMFTKFIYFLFFYSKLGKNLLKKSVLFYSITINKVRNFIN